MARVDSWVCRVAVTAIVASMSLSLAGCEKSTPSPTPPATTAPTSTSGASATSGSTDSPPSPTRPASSSPSTGSALPYPVDVPSEARVNSPAGAKAFVGHFFRTVNTAFTGSRTGAILPLSLPSCATCQGFEDKLAEYQQAKSHYDRPALTIREISTTPRQPRFGGTTLDVVAMQEPAKVLTIDGVMVETITGKEAVLSVEVVFDGQVWRMASIRVQG